MIEVGLRENCRRIGESKLFQGVSYKSNLKQTRVIPGGEMESENFYFFIFKMGAFLVHLYKWKVFIANGMIPERKKLQEPFL